MTIGPNWVGDHEKQKNFRPRLGRGPRENKTTIGPNWVGDHEKQKNYRPRLGRGPRETKRL